MLLASLVNVLTAVLALVGNLFYVLVYTRWLKRSTPQNIVIGGAAGAVPPLVGWAAATGNLTLPALWLFLIVFFWTPPHFWALALLIRRDYEAARDPDAAVVRGERETTRQIVLYSLVLVGGHARSVRLGAARPRSTSAPRSLLGGGLPLARRAACGARRRRAGRRAALPLLAALPRAALRRDGGGSAPLMAEPTAPVEPTSEVAGRERRARAGAARAGVLIAAGAIVVALIYLQYD